MDTFKVSVYMGRRETRLGFSQFSLRIWNREYTDTDDAYDQ